jgi:hypothetical protein
LNTLQKETYTKIKDWLTSTIGTDTEINDKTKDEIRIEISPKNNDSAVPIYILTVPDPNLILIGWVWGFHSIDTYMFKMIRKEKLQTLKTNLELAALQLGVNIYFQPSIDNLKCIECQKLLTINLINRDNFILSFSQISKALNVAGQRVQMDLGIPDRMDPSILK